MVVRKVMVEEKAQLKSLRADEFIRFLVKVTLWCLELGGREDQSKAPGGQATEKRSRLEELGDMEEELWRDLYDTRCKLGSARRRAKLDEFMGLL